MKLNVGCGRNILQGWVNIDSASLPGVDIVINLERCSKDPLPFADNTFEEILLSHVLEHIQSPLPLMQELHRISKPDAKMTIIVPYGSSDDAYEDPTHVRQFFLQSFGYFSQPFYWKADYGYKGDWQPKEIVLHTNKKCAKDEFFKLLNNNRNVVKEMTCYLEAVKPMREPKKELRSYPKVTVSGVEEQTQTQHTRILVAIPNFSDAILISCVKSVYTMNVPHNVEVTVEFVSGYGIARARNLAAKMAVDGKYDYILYIDSDQIVPKNTIEKLLACNSDVSAGWSMTMFTGNKTNISTLNTKTKFYELMTVKDVPNGIIQVDAIGFAAILIKTSVFEKMKYPYFRYIEYEDGGTLSEDLFFCQQCKAIGVPILCDTSLKIGHIKSITL